MGGADDGDQPPAKRMGLGSGPLQENLERLKNVAEAPPLLASGVRSPGRGVWVSIGAASDEPDVEGRKPLLAPPAPVAEAPTLLASAARAPPPPARWSPSRGVWVSIEVAAEEHGEEGVRQKKRENDETQEVNRMRPGVPQPGSSASTSASPRASTSPSMVATSTSPSTSLVGAAHGHHTLGKDPKNPEKEMEILKRW